jgi:hypothetical protein
MEISYAAFGQEFVVECSSHLKPFQAKCAWKALEGLVTISRHVAGNSGKAPLTGFHSTLGRLLRLYRAGQEVKKVLEL